MGLKERGRGDQARGRRKDGIKRGREFEKGIEGEGGGISHF